MQFPDSRVAPSVTAQQKAGVCVGHDRREGLLDLVRDRRHQLAGKCHTGRVGELDAGEPQLLLRAAALGDVATGKQYGAALDRDRLDEDEEPPHVAGLRPHFPFDVGNLPGGSEPIAIEEVLPEERRDPTQCLDLVRYVPEDDVDVGADVRESALVVGEKDGVGDRVERGAMELFRFAQRSIPAFATPVG